MRLIKMFGLAAVAAVAAMAFVGASSASATNSTLLCKNNLGALNECSAPVTTIHGIATEPLLHTSLGNVKCASSLVEATAEGLGNPQVVNLNAANLTWTTCKTHSGFNCEVETILGGKLNVLKLSSTDAHVTSQGAVTVLVKCPFLHCAYAGTPSLLALPTEGVTPAILHANTKVVSSAVHKFAGGCPSESTWLALYLSLEGQSIYFKT